jgi:predicted esterase
MFEPSNRAVQAGGDKQSGGEKASGIDVGPKPTSAESQLGLKDLSRIATEPHLFPLPVPGFPEAVVAIPSAPSEPRPVVVVLHGMGDRPEPHCEAWRTITSAYGFVLCPRGQFDPARSSADRRRYTHPGGEALRQHIDAALAALSDRYGTLVDTTHPLLSGFSLGASEAAVLAQQEAERFSRVALLEGGLDVWWAPNIGQFGWRGGTRVLFGCGSAWCTPPARAAAMRIDAEGIEAHVTFADVGHHVAPSLQDALRAELPWFVDGDPRWQALR